jgi:hypothetical protein
MCKKGEGVVASKDVAQTPCSKFQVSHPFVYVNMEVSCSWNLLKWEIHQWRTQNWLLSSLMGPKYIAVLLLTMWSQVIQEFQDWIHFISGSILIKFNKWRLCSGNVKKVWSVSGGRTFSFVWWVAGVKACLSEITLLEGEILMWWKIWFLTDV